MPQRLDAAAWLALQTRARTPRVLAGLQTPPAEWTPGFEMTPKGLYSKRLFESALVIYEHLWRLASAAPSSANIATAMTQLVAGLAPSHPHWKMTGDRFADRDAHQSAVRRQLDELAAAGVLRWQAGVNLEGEDARTEIQLLEPPSLSPAELKAARAQLRKWKRLHGATLHTGAPTGIPHPLKAAKPLSAADCKLLARNRVQQIRASRIRAASPTSTAPPFGTASAFGGERNHSALSSHDRSRTNACGVKTGVTRTSASARTSVSAAPEDPAEIPDPAATSPRLTSSTEGRVQALALDARASEGPEPASESQSQSGPEDLREAHDPWPERVAALLEHVRIGEQERERKIEVTVGVERARMLRVAGWSTDRGWPTGELQRAWICARYGARALHDVTRHYAGQVEAEDLERLRRAATRWERAADCPERPDGTPAGGLAMLLHLAAHGRGRGLAGTIVELDRWSKDLAAVADLHDPHAARRRYERACKRHGLEPDTRLPIAATGPLGFRTRAPLGGRWAPWVRRDEHGRPLIVCQDPPMAPGQQSRFYTTICPDDPSLVVALAVVEGREAFAPAVQNKAHQEQLQDALLITYRGDRRCHTAKHERLAHPIGQPAEPSSHLLELRHRPNADVIELAHRTGLPRTTAASMLQPGQIGTQLLAQERQLEDQHAQADAAATRDALAEHARQITADPRAHYHELQARWRDNHSAGIENVDPAPRHQLTEHHEDHGRFEPQLPHRGEDEGVAR